MAGLLAALALAMTACGTAATTPPSTVGPSAAGSSATVGPSGSATSASHTLTIAIDSDFQTFDPNHSSFQEANELNYNVYDQFFHLGTKAGPSAAITQYDSSSCQPMAIDKFTVATDGMSVDLHVRDGMTFHKSGNPVTAADLIWMFDHAKADKGSQIYGAMSFVGMNSWQQTGAQDVTVTLSKPLNQNLFCQYFRQQEIALLDSKDIEAHITPADPLGSQYIAKTPDLGSGVYEVASYTPGSQMVLQAYPKYWGTQPYYDRIVIQIVTDEATRTLSLRQGAVDIAEYLGQDSLASLQGQAGVQVLSIPTRNQMEMGLHFIPPFDNQLVRQALEYAIPYSDIVAQIYKGNAQVSTGVIPNLGQDNDPSTYPYTYDPAKAKALLTQAGDPNGVSFTCAYQEGLSTQEQLMVLLQGRLAAAGFTLTLDKLTAANFSNVLGDVKTTQCWAREILWYVDDPGYIGSFVGSTTTPLPWWGPYGSPELDAVITQMEAPADTPAELTAKQAAATQYQQMVNTIAPMVWLGDLNFQVATSTKVCGYQQQPDNLLYYAGFKAC